MPAPDWAHKLLDLAWGVPGDDPAKSEPGGSLYTYMPLHGFWMRQHSVPGAVFSAGFEYSKRTFTVDFRNSKTGKWSVTTEQPQPEHVPPIVEALS